MSKIANKRFGLKFRPASMGAIPGGTFFSIQEAGPGEQNVARHGVITFERPLSDQEIRAFELVLLADEDDVRALARDVAQSMSRYADAYLSAYEEDPGVALDAVARGLKKARPYQVHVGSLEVFGQSVMEQVRAMTETAADMTEAAEEPQSVSQDSPG